MPLPTPLEILDASTAGSPFGPEGARDQRTVKILAKTVYRELRAAGLAEEDLMTVAGELLHLVAVDMRDRRRGDDAADFAGAGR